MNRNRTLASFCCLTIILMLAGCAGYSKTFVGSKVTSAPVVTIKQGVPDAGTWKTFDITIDYNCTLNGEAFAVSGQAVLSDHYSMMYEWLKDLRVFFFMLDTDMHVLAAIPVARSMTGDVDEKLKFSNSLQAPPGTTGFSFGYDGQVTNDRLGTTSFYNLPLN